MSNKPSVCSECLKLLKTKRYYCCNKEELVCGYCLQKICKKCQNSRKNMIEIKIKPEEHKRQAEKFKICSSCKNKEEVYEDMFYDNRCEIHFCHKCLRKKWRVFYQNNSKQVKDKQRFKLIQILLNCGCYEKAMDIENYLRKCCSHCSNKIIYDFTELITGEKIMNHHLVDMENSKQNNKIDKQSKMFKEIEKLLIVCSICNSRLKAKNDLGEINIQGLMICKVCLNQERKASNEISNIKLIVEQQKIKICCTCERKIRRQQFKQLGQNIYICVQCYKLNVSQEEKSLNNINKLDHK